jgi:hypothetical protein
VARSHREALHVAGPFVCRCPSISPISRLHLPLIEPGRADFPHPAFAQGSTRTLTRSVTDSSPERGVSDPATDGAYDRHAVAITPVGPQVGSSRSPETCDSGLPHPFAGSAPTLNVSRPAQRSLTLRPGCSRSPPRDPFHQGLRQLRYFRCRSDCYRLERPFPGGNCTH